MEDVTWLEGEFSDYGYRRNRNDFAGLANYALLKRTPAGYKARYGALDMNDAAKKARAYVWVDYAVPHAAAQAVVDAVAARHGWGGVWESRTKNVV